MKNLLKKLIVFLSIHFSLFFIALAVLFIFTDNQIFEPDQEEQAKAGKQFWEWPSPYGPLNLHYIEKGEGTRDILLIHGFRSYSYTWHALIDPLANGLSDKPEKVPYNKDFFTQQIHAFMEAKGIAKANLIGNSMGGGLALSLTIAYPDDVKSLILLNALGYPLEIPFHLSLGKYCGQLLSPLFGPSLVRSGIKKIIYDPEQITEEQVEAYSLPYRFPGGVKASLLTLQNFENESLNEMSHHYPSLTVPTLIIWGDHDSLIPVSHFEKFKEDFPIGETLLIEKCGHLPQEETPDQVLTSILNFLYKNESEEQHLQGESR